MQPRPITTLHVGGGLTVDGGFTTGSITTGSITAGSITASGPITTPSLTTSVLQVNGNANVTGTLTAGTVTGYVQPTSLYSTGRIAIAASDALGIGTAAGSSGVLEIGVASGGGAAKIAFHRHGVYAAYFGLDTDNVWRVGGWSMGAVAYQLWHTGHFTYSPSVVGSTLVQRTPEGYINANYVNSTADIQGVAPVYVAGQGGDGYLRWYPKSLVAVGGTTYQTSGAWTNIGQGALSGAHTGDLIIMYTNKAGHMHVSIYAGVGQGGGDAFAQLHLYVNGGHQMSGPSMGAAASSQAQYAVLHHAMQVASGWSVSIRASGTANAHLNQGADMRMTIGPN